MPSRSAPGVIPSSQRAVRAAGGPALTTGLLVAGLMLGATVASALPLTVVTSTVPDAGVGVPYSTTLVADLGSTPYTWTLDSGTLPAGLTLTGASGVISGTATLSGSSGFVVLVTDALGDTASRAFTLAVVEVPAAVSDLAVARTTSGNDADGTVKLLVTFTPTPFTASAEVYRAPFGGYPRYDEAGGLTPAVPSYPPGAPWTLTSVTASGQSDEPATRDAWSYVVFVKNSVGQVSAVSNRTAPAPDYALGDVTNGLVAGQGDNQVTDADVSMLGAHYGISGAAITTAGVSVLDVGPTVDLGMGSRPFTDERIDFEDLIVFATNYGAVSAPQARVAAAESARRAASAPERLTLVAPAEVQEGDRFSARVRMTAAGRVQGLSVAVGFDAAVVEPLAVESAGWVEAQHGIVLSPNPAVFDAALLGARGARLQGEGELARVTFRALRSGAPGLRFARVEARDAANRALAAGDLELGPDARPTRTLLFAPAPNPAPAGAQLGFALVRDAQVELTLHSVDGRVVRRLAHGPFAAGVHRLTWDGRDEARHAVAPGLYFVRLQASGEVLTRTLIHLR